MKISNRSNPYLDNLMRSLSTERRDVKELTSYLQSVVRRLYIEEGSQVDKAKVDLIPRIFWLLMILFQNDLFLWEYDTVLHSKEVTLAL